MIRVFGVPVYDLERQATVIRNISGSPILQRCYTPEDPKKTFFNICSYVLNDRNADPREATRTTVIKLFYDMDFDCLFGEYEGKYQCWEDYAYHIFDDIYGKQKCRGKSTSLIHFFQWDIDIIIPEEEAVIPSFNQRIMPVEMAFICKVITDAVFSNKRKFKKDYAVLSREYFLHKANGKKESLSENYKKKTGRTLNRTKLACIWDLLDKYKFIIVQRRKSKGRHLPNRFSLGVRNYRLEDLGNAGSPKKRKSNKNQMDLSML